MSDKTFVALFDIHIGREVVYNISKSTFEERPTHDLKFIKKVFNFISDFKPNYVILGGDQLDFSSISRFNKGSAIDQINEVLTRDYDDLDRYIISPLNQLNSNIIWLQGNHDDRIVDFLKKHPVFTGLIEPWSYLVNLPAIATMKNRGELFNLGKLWFMHGDNLSCSGDIAKNAHHYQRNIRFGHFHTHRAYTIHNPTDSKDVKTCIAVPALCKRAPGYGNKKPNQWLQGFNYGYVSKRGNFQDYVVIDTPEGIRVEGKNYL